MAPALGARPRARPHEHARDLPVALSFAVPFALVRVILLIRRADLVGGLVNRCLTTVAASVVAAMIIGLNGFLLYGTFFG